MIIKNPKYTQFKTGSGMQVFFYPVPGIRHCEVSLYIKTGPVYETPENNGIAHFLEHMLFRGCKKYPTAEKFSNYLDSISGMMNGFTTRTFTSFNLHILSRFLEKGLFLMQQMFDEPLFLEIETEKKIVCEEALEDINDKKLEINLDNIIKQLIFSIDSKMALPILGKVRNINNFSAEMVQSFYEQEYRASNVSLCCVGKFKEKKIAEILSHFQFKNSTPQNPNPVHSHINKGPLFKFTDNNQSRVDFQLSLTGPGQQNKDIFKFIIVRKLLNGGMNSLLYNEICVKKGLAYDVEINADLYPSVSTLDIIIPASPSNIIKIFENLLLILRNFREKGVAEEKLLRVKRNYIFDVEYTLDNFTFVAEWLSVSHLFGLNFDFREKIENIQALSLSDINEYIRDLFVKENFYIATVGPLSKKDGDQLRFLAENF